RSCCSSPHFFLQENPTNFLCAQQDEASLPPSHLAPVQHQLTLTLICWC
uniref:Uncharacterized protein n=1 Tax=Aegilops tauschii subsp. strangulata TaxID=200361 RepID=A0A453NE99_AEGTS